MKRVIVSIAAIGSLFLWFALDVPPIDRVGRKIDRLMKSIPEVKAYSYRFYEGEARPLDVWLVGGKNFLGLYSVGSRDLVQPNHAEIQQIGELMILCQWSHVTKSLAVEADPGINLANLAKIQHRNNLTPEFLVREYDAFAEWASRLSADKLNPTRFPGIEFPDGYGSGGRLIDFACWTSPAAVPDIPSDALYPRGR